MKITEYAIQCDGKHEGDKPDYYPLTVTKICEMLEVARTAKKWTGVTSGGATMADVQVRLAQGIPGMTCPRPDIGDVSDRLHDLDRAYVAWIDDPLTLFLKDLDIKPTDEIVIRLCGLMGIQEM